MEIPWTGRCQRCTKESGGYTMSMFSPRLICFACKDLEEKRADYKDAVAADTAAVRSGNYNFEGIGGD